MFSLEVGDVLGDVENAVGSEGFIRVDDLVDFCCLVDIVEGEGKILLPT